jgi:predicted transposase/invertase (TIGR01784 family)
MSDIILPRSVPLFQAVFGSQHHPDILTQFLNAVIDLPDEDVAQVTLLHPNPPGDDALKRSTLDVLAETTKGRLIKVDVNLEVEPGVPDRVAHFSEKMLARLRPGWFYDEMREPVTILIVEEQLFSGGTGYHHQYWWAEPETGSLLTQLCRLHTLELAMVPRTTDGSDLWKWLSFIGADDEEELDMAARLDPVIGEAVTLVRRFSEDEEFRLRHLDHEKRLADQPDPRCEAAREGREEGS